MGTIDELHLDRLQAFVAVAETGSFTGAAGRLRAPKSSVSRAVAALEGDLGVRLVHRTTRRVSLSTAGAALHERIAPLIAALKSSLGDLPEREEAPAGLLRVSAPGDFGATVAAELCAQFLARFPLVSIELRLSNTYVDLVAEGFDVALRISMRRLADSSLAARALGSPGLQLYAAPSYLARRGTPRSPAELDGHDWVIFRAAAPIKLDGTGCPGATVTPRGRLVADDMAVVHRAARAGVGLALLPSFLAEPDLPTGGLARVLPRLAARAGTIYFVTPSARNPPRKVVAFRDFLVDALADR